METPMKRLKEIVILLALAVVLISAMSVSGCNTIRGAGRDIENLGKALQ